MLGIRVERGESRHGAYEHAHGVGIVLQALHELLDVLVDVGVVGDVVGPLVELVAGGQLTEENEIRRLQEVGVLGQLLDGVAAVFEDTAFAVDVGDGAAAGRGGGGLGGEEGWRWWLAGTEVDSLVSAQPPRSAPPLLPPPFASYQETA